ncbi:tetraacyldisaccharide 4'-kinase [Helicobacter mehlei]|uniref:Tetraacyldisaccharide 4'-kinase n=1 Tax=Helicobacter mehlei TaxID=2316080 RepID=A0A553V1C9_9HELI|nr:tetraacyldisaccharide 4'-kinase [Helicobacter mehlei]TSA86240.1 tetraacyldisaccharide 4'-kinase [Helicobacter mehlei]
MTWLERYFYAPSLSQKILAYSLYPISLIYTQIATLKRTLAHYEDLHIPIISVGNLIAGGSGKTPFILEIAQDLAPHYHVGVISRGYGRGSQGCQVVSLQGEVLIPQIQAGDEAFLLATQLKKASVIVSVDRKEGILQAKQLGAQVVLLDDGFRFAFKKLNIVLKPAHKPYFDFCLPSGIYREPVSCYDLADLLIEEGLDYRREVKLLCPSPRMLLVSAIAHPSRLDPYLPPVVGKLYFKDHARFDLCLLQKAFKEHGATSLLVTSKDAVKLADCPLPLSVLDLRLLIEPAIKAKILGYVKTQLKSL